MSQPAASTHLSNYFQFWRNNCSEFSFSSLTRGVKHHVAGFIWLLSWQLTWTQLKKLLRLTSYLSVNLYFYAFTHINIHSPQFISFTTPEGILSAPLFSPWQSVWSARCNSTKIKDIFSPLARPTSLLKLKINARNKYIPNQFSAE